MRGVTKPTARVAAKRSELGRLWRSIAQDSRHPDLLEGRLPPDWAAILEGPVPGQVRVTLRMDRDVAKWFRSFGPGYQNAVARVLRGFMLYRLSEIADAVEAVEPLTSGEETAGKLEAELVLQLYEVRARRLKGVWGE